MMKYGEQAVGYNPADEPDIEWLKRRYAEIINYCDLVIDMHPNDQEKKRLLGIAITEAMTAAMWAVKAMEWQSRKPLWQTLPSATPAASPNNSPTASPAQQAA
jgi:hypothetical protein